MTRACLAVAAGLAACLTPTWSLSAPDPAPTDAGGFIRITPGQIHWVTQPGSHGARFATVLGDPGKPGLYVIRGQFPPHMMDTPHWHSQDRYVTVLQGTWYTGTGPVFDASKAVPLGPGSLMKHPARGVHWDGSAGDETVIVQIVGQGPVETQQVDPKGPGWIEVHR
jgi:hypothetical protein